MRQPRSSTPTIIGLVSLILLYILLIALILFFSNEVLSNITKETPISGVFILPLAFILPLFLFIIILYNIFKLIRDRRQNKPGARLKARLILFFTLITLLSSIPQGLLSLNFISTTLTSWFSVNIGESLRGGLDIALEYYDQELKRLKGYTNSTIFSDILQNNIEKEPWNVWELTKETHPSFDAIQIFDEKLEPYLFRGNDQTYMEEYSFRQKTTGILPKKSTGSLSILRSLKKYSNDTGTYFIVISSILPERFNTKAEELTRTIETFNLLDRYQNFFRIGIIILYTFFAAPMILLAILISFLLTDELLRPLVSLEEATKHVTEGDFSIRILSRPDNELSMLVNSFNKMVSELDKSRKKLRQTEKIAAWQDIAQRLAHELKNPLTPIKLSAERIRKKYHTNPEQIGRVVEPAVESIISEVENLNKLLSEFRDFARIPNPQKQWINIHKVVSDVLQIFRESSPGVNIQLNMPENLQIKADPAQMKQVFTNLANNAIEALGGPGSLSVHADLVKKANSHYCRIQVHDTGHGIEAKHHEEVFNPYFTTKKSGTGLGLAIVERIIFDHNGQIWFESKQDRGTTFFIDLPTE